MLACGWTAGRALAGIVLCIAAAFGSAGRSDAAIIEEVLDIDVATRTRDGLRVAQSIRVTVFRDESRAQAPYLVLNHGRPAATADLATMGRQRFAVNARYFVSLGFVVLVPTRIGYGVSVGPDVEHSGRCDDRQFAPVLAAAADQVADVLHAAAQLPYVDPTRGLVAGQSFGGATAIALSARPLPGLKGVVNFAGGSGGNPTTRPARPCSAERLTLLYRRYGAASTVPTLWLYSENDRFWGPELPRIWFSAFVEAGGQGQFVQTPAYGTDGHRAFVADPDGWRPAFETFLRRVGLHPRP